jgi:subtilase family serine protease
MSARRPYGLSPSAIKSAYGFPTGLTAGEGRTIAIVSAYNAPHVEGDLSVFSRQYGLPSCTTANRCFLKVSQTGSTSTYPRSDAGWALETSMDVEWAHAIAPGADILLVEANTPAITNLLKAEDYARRHAQYVSNSWGGSELSNERTYDGHFAQSGVSVFVASGDDGLGAEYPSSSPAVISVGGTTLSGVGTPALKETGWSGSGGGCSHFESARTEQLHFGSYSTTGCAGKRATPDVSLDADPTSGVSVYDSTPYQGSYGWYALGGTSAATPMWAGRAAVSGAIVDSKYVYGRTIRFRDITSGDNGASCHVGFDLVTGRGSWTG